MTVPSPHIEVRRAGPSDAELVQTLLLELADHDGGAEHVRVTPARWRELLAERHVVVLVALADGDPVGYASATRTSYLWGGCDLLALDDLYVRGRARNLGVGARLMSAIAAHAAEDRLLVRWEAEVGNLGAHRFYRRLGANLRPKMIATWAPDAYGLLAE